MNDAVEKSASIEDSTSIEDSASMALVKTIRQRIESRYRRILFVHQELAKLDKAAKQKEKNNPSASFEDFVFNTIDFSIYKKIEAEEFNLLFDEGLADYSEAFYKKFFNMNSTETRAVINNSYIRVGPFYVCKKSSPLLLSIMRTLHSSLEFVPLLDAKDISVEQLGLTAELLDGVIIRHDDNSETKLFIPGNNPGSRESSSMLCGTFHPLGKACTITLIPAQ